MKRSEPYSEEFKAEAVKLVREQNLPASQVARDLGVYPETLRRWMRELTSARDGMTAPASSSAGEVARLQWEIERLRMERDILKKRSASSRGCHNDPEIPVRGRPGERVSGHGAVPGVGAGP
jgi:transposase